MPLFEFNDDEALGIVRAVDTATVKVAVENIDLLRKLQVNRLVVLQSSKPGQHLVGVVQKITRSTSTATAMGFERDEEDSPEEQNLVSITLIGTFIDQDGTEKNIFRRTLETVPEIDACCFPIEGNELTEFMRAISYLGSTDTQRLSLGNYTLDENAEAYLNANRFFQRHAVVVGSTGSGKSWTTARLLEQVAELPHANSILFDIHGEYETLTGDGIKHYRIAGPNDLRKSSSFDDGILYLPFWLLSYDEMTSMFVDQGETAAANQAMLLSRTVTEAKRKYLEDGNHDDVLANFTIDSPVPFSLRDVLEELSRLNSEMVPGANNKQKQGEFHGKLSRFVARLENKVNDRRLGFMLSPPEETHDFDWLPQLSKLLLAGTHDQDKKKGGVKVVDFSEVPSDILPLIVGRLASLVFQVQQWTPRVNRHPIAMFCDEAHLYIPERANSSASASTAVYAFERIAKEGRKYGVGLVVISQRPSEVSRTVLSQCNNFVALRLTNAEDQNVVQRLLPDSLGGYSSLLPILDRGEALVVGDASLLPSRIRITPPNSEPNSGTVDFWDEWSRVEPREAITKAVHSWRSQSFASMSSKKPTKKKKKKASK